MDETPLFQGLDEQERIYAPQQLPAGSEEHLRVEADEGAAAALPGIEPPAAAPVANIGTAQATQAAAAPPNLGHDDPNVGPGAPSPDAGDPLDSEDR